MPAVFPTRPHLPGNGLLQESVDASTTPPVLSAIYGESDIGAADAVAGVNFSTGAGVSGSSQGGIAVYGSSQRGIAVYGESAQNEGVRGVSHVAGHAGVTGENTGGGPGIYAHGGNAPFSGAQFQGAALFDGDIRINGSINGDCQLQGNLKVAAPFDIQLETQDCAEDFPVVDGADVTPGTVMVVGADARLRASSVAYDRTVVGVIAGAAESRPAIILGRKPDSAERTPVALLGRVYCKVDADCSPIEVGDLLTTSNRAGHAMKAVQPLEALGAVIGKAMGSLQSGQGLIPILVALQ